MARTITGTIPGLLVLSLSDPLGSGGSDNPLIITSTGTIVGGISGAADTDWTIINDGTIPDVAGSGISLAGSGLLDNSGVISAFGDGVEIGSFGLIINEGSIYGGLVGVEIGGNGVIENQGSIDSLGLGIDIIGTGTVSNEGSIFGFGAGVALGEGSVMNWGSITGSDGFGVMLANGGSVTNYGYIGALGGGVWGMDGISSVTNQGLIQSFEGFASGVELDEGSVDNLGTILGGYSGVQLGDGEITNRGTISGYFSGITLGNGEVSNHGTILGGVEITAGSGTLTNQGLISGGANHPGISVLFDPTTANNLLVIKPGAVFNGAVEATSGSNSTIELANGSGAVSGVGGGQFNGFDTLQAGSGANWTLNGSNTIGTVLNDGRLDVAGSLEVTTAVDPDSTGIFQLDGPSTLEIAAALGTDSTISFATGSNLVIDSYGLFGENVGTTSYAGPLLENFGGSTVDLEGFGIAGLSMSFSDSSGLLQLTNAASQMATLTFQTSSLGAGAFNFISDGGTGVLITHS
jgi:hypothetical protein